MYRYISDEIGYINKNSSVNAEFCVANSSINIYGIKLAVPGIKRADRQLIINIALKNKLSLFMKIFSDFWLFMFMSVEQNSSPVCVISPVKIENIIHIKVKLDRVSVDIIIIAEFIAK